MDDWVLRVPWPGVHAEQSEPLLTREWLVTNGLGGYASGTLAGVASRRYHGLLIAALPAPLGRWVMLNHLSELVRLPDCMQAFLGGEERTGGQLDVPGSAYLTEFRLDQGLPIWRFQVGNSTIEKHVLLVHGQNTVHIEYRLVAGNGPLRLKLRPSLHFRPHDAPVSAPAERPYAITVSDHRYDVRAGTTPPLRLYLHGQRSAFTV
jgi:predicted glycogen debranching enzyme